MDSLLSDLRYAARKLALTPGFTVVAILTLGLAIGATTTVYSVVDAVLIRPLPFTHTVVGVAPAGFRYPGSPNFWVPLVYASWETTPGGRALREEYAVGRLRARAARGEGGSRHRDANGMTESSRSH